MVSFFLNFLAQLAMDPIINTKLWKTISSFHTFQYLNGQKGITSLMIDQFQNFNYYYKWENVYVNNINQKINFDHVHRRVSFKQNESHIIFNMLPKFVRCWTNNITYFL